MTSGNSPTGKWNIRRLAIIAVTGAAVVAGGYFLAPRVARSAADVPGRDLHAELNQALWARVEAERHLQAVRAELETVKAQAAESAAQARKARAEVERARGFIQDLHARLDRAEQAVKPLREDLAARDKQLRLFRAQVKQAEQQAERLKVELASARKQVEALRRARQALRKEQARLARALEMQKRTNADLAEFLSVLDLGGGRPAPAPTPPARTPPEPPITTWEVVYCAGYPTLVFRDGAEEQLHWGKQHVVRAVDGIVREIDARPATRALLARLGSVQPAVAPPAGPWRVGKGQSLRYTDLVAMFGRPERVSGTGRRFTAWWTVGAWARQASATVEEGAVIAFDGRGVDPPALCGLVRHRPEAYRAATRAVKDQAAVARACYRLAQKVVGAEVNRLATLAARDGRQLQKWSLAPFESVGTWIAPTSTPAGSIVLRSAVDFTWAGLDGTRRLERRFVVVRFVTDSGQIRAEGCDLFAPRT